MEIKYFKDVTINSIEECKSYDEVYDILNLGLQILKDKLKND